MQPVRSSNPYKTLLKFALLGALSFPLFGLAQNINSLSSNVSQSFTVCSQDAVEKRDTALSVARQTYNDAIKQALSVRKESLKKALSIKEDKEQEKLQDEAQDEYRVSQKESQITYNDARETIWDTFNEDIKSCREIRKALQDKNEAEKKSVAKKK